MIPTWSLCRPNFCRGREALCKLPVFFQGPETIEHSSNKHWEYGKIGVIRNAQARGVKEQCANAEFFCLVLSIAYTVCGWNKFDINISKNWAPRCLVIVFCQPRKQHLGKIALNSLHHVVQGSLLVVGVWAAESGHLPSELRKKSINFRSQQKGQGKSYSNPSMIKTQESTSNFLRQVLIQVWDVVIAHGFSRWSQSPSAN